MTTLNVFHISSLRDVPIGGDVKYARDVLAGKVPGVSYTLVARVETEVESHDALEVAYDLTNHVHHDWRRNLGVQCLVAGANPPRSTSVGDLIECNGHKYMVAGCGFKGL